MPYEKGFHFVYYLDRVVGRKNFDKFIPYCECPWRAAYSLFRTYFEPSCSASNSEQTSHDSCLGSQWRQWSRISLTSKCYVDFNKWTNKSLDSYEFKDTFLEFFDKPEYADLKDKIAQIDWEGRFYSPGMPPKPEFDTSLIDVCYKLAEQWKDKVSSLYLKRWQNFLSTCGLTRISELRALAQRC